MSSKQQVSINIGGGLFAAIGMVLIILKLAEVAPVADWSWWIVTLPFWFGFALLLGFIVFLGIVGLIGGILYFIIKQLD